MLAQLLASEAVFVVVFFMLVAFGLWLISGGPMRRRDQRPRERNGRVVVSLFGGVGIGALWLGAGLWSLLGWMLRRHMTERRARQLAKGGSFKNKL